MFTLADGAVSRCDVCGLYLLDRAPVPGAAGKLDRSRFDDAFRELRTGNYERILDALETTASLAGAAVLDVGCSSGWFLAAAERRGGRCFGIEPDAYFHDQARRSLPDSVALVNGFFPADLPADWPAFDLITFHDVFEHLEDPRQVLEHCAQRLKPGGRLVLSVPSSRGFVFRLALLLRRMGIPGPLERAFQVHYPFPHLLYLDAESVAALAATAGFEVVRVLSLPGFRLRGSLRRAQMDAAGNAAGRLGVWANAGALALFGLLQPVVQADNIAVILRRTSG